MEQGCKPRSMSKERGMPLQVFYDAVAFRSCHGGTCTVPSVTAGQRIYRYLEHEAHSVTRGESLGY